MFDVLLDSFLDTVKTLPFLIGAYLLIEWIAHRAGDRFKNGLRRTGRFGPAGGAVLGLVPQCGFSVAAVSFYADRMITPGTLIAVFIATSDEAIPVLLANPGSGDLILKLMAIKLVLAVVIGFAVDLGLRRFWKPVWDAHSELQHDHATMENHGGCCDGHHNHGHEWGRGGGHSVHVNGSGLRAHAGVAGHERRVHAAGHGKIHRAVEPGAELHREEAHPHHADCDHGHCDHCDNQLCEHCCSHTKCHDSILKTALIQTGKVALLIFIVSAVLNFAFESLGEARTAELLMSGSVFQPVIAALFGLIPSCASSVVLTQLYIEGSLAFGSVLAGLFTGAGAGMLVLFRVVRSKKECLLIVAGLVVAGSLIGMIL